jgi:hypothetical protein
MRLEWSCSPNLDNQGDVDEIFTMLLAPVRDSGGLKQWRSLHILEPSKLINESSELDFDLDSLKLGKVIAHPTTPPLSLKFTISSESFIQLVTSPCTVQYLHTTHRIR